MGVNCIIETNGLVLENEGANIKIIKGNLMIRQI